MKTTHFQRRPAGAQVSIERLFAEIRRHLPEDCRAEVAECPEYSRGLWPRVKNLIWARKRAGGLNHIVGDVHYLAFGLPKRGLILTVHDCAALNRLSGFKREVLKYFWFTGPMRRARVVTTISETTKKELRKWIGGLADKVVVVPNCVNAEFEPYPKPFGDPPVVLQVGTGWNKNLERVAEALRGTPGQLEVVGELRAGQRERLEAAGISYRVLGRVSDEELVEAYRRCDLVVFASLYEGFGLPVLEAQATGRPVITSNRSSLPEAAGAGALFINPESVEEIRDAVIRLVEDTNLRENFVRKGFENVERFRPEAVAARYAEVYERVNGDVSRVS